MTKKRFPSNIHAQALDVQDAWARIDEQLTAGTVNLAALVTEIDQLHEVESILAGVENQLLEVRTRREEICLSIWDKVKRVRSVVKGVYGDDSFQYEMVGGKRRSDRKSPRRAAVPAES